MSEQKFNLHDQTVLCAFRGELERIILSNRSDVVMRARTVQFVDQKAISFKMRTCSVCWDIFSNANAAKANYWCANHPVCDNCIHLYMKTCIQERRPVIRCCGTDRGCSFTVTLQIASLVLSAEDFESFHQYQEERVRFAFTCLGCSGTRFRLAKLSPLIHNSSQFVCIDCNGTYCLFCHEPVSNGTILGSLVSPFGFGKGEEHYRHTCSNPLANDLAKHVLDPANRCRPCPNCFKLVHRFEGCSNMICEGHGGCGQRWCWKCLVRINGAGCVCEHHNGYPPTLRFRMIDRLSSGARQCALGAVQVVSLPILAAGIVIGLPWRMYLQHLDRLELERLRNLENITREGIDVFLVSGGIPNAADDLFDYADAEYAVSFVQAFARESSGRWLGGARSAAGEERCFVSYECLNGAAVVRVHPHAENDKQCPQCNHSDRNPRRGRNPNPLKVTLTNLSVFPFVDDVEGSPRRSRKTFKYINDECLLAIKRQGVDLSPNTFSLSM